MAIFPILTNTSSTISASVTGGLYLIGRDATVSTTGVGVDGGNAASNKSIVVQGSVIAENDAIRVGTETGGVNLVEVAPGGYLFSQSHAVEAKGGSNTVLNAGTISGGFRTLSLFGNNNSVTNEGLISALIVGVYFAGEDNVLTNYGRIISKGESVAMIGAGNSILNFGDIVSNASGGNEAVVIFTSPGDSFSIVNHGRIAGDTAILTFTGIGTIANHGEISGEISTGNNADSLENTGLIDGDIDLGNDADTLLNLGTILGNVTLGSGADIYDGRGGRVVGEVRGGDGDDTYFVDDTETVLVEDADAGTDSVIVSVSYSLLRNAGANFENLTLAGTGDLHGIGNAQANVLIGNGGDNFLNGKQGADTMEGGEGDDTYHVDDAGDVVLEAPGEGVDHVKASVSYTLGAGQEIESLKLIGKADIDATGNEFDNTLTGNRGDNRIDGGLGDDVLFGMDGADVLIGGGGDDRLFGGSGDDRLFGGSGDDSLDGGAGDDELYGGAGDDTMAGGAGADTMTGSVGADVFVFARAGDLGIGATRDVITDFETGVDVVDLTALDLTFVAGGFTGAAGDIRYSQNNEQLKIDIDGDTTADFEILLDGLGAAFNATTDLLV